MKLAYIRFTLLICLQIGSVFFISAANAQSPVSSNHTTSELGFGLGAVNYKGEIAPKYRFSNNRPAAMVFYRRDISAPLTLRGNILLGTIGASDNYFDLPLNQFRQARLSGTLLEAAAGIEYNFLDYYDLRRRQRWTPYFFVQAAGFYASVNSKSDIGAAVPDGQVSQLVTQDNAILSFSIPAGVGIKFALSHNWNLGAEIGARKTFTDQLDNLGEEQGRALANPNDNDWYFYNGFSISYTFYKLNCAKVYRGKPTPLE